MVCCEAAEATRTFGSSRRGPPGDSGSQPVNSSFTSPRAAGSSHASTRPPSWLQRFTFGPATPVAVNGWADRIRHSTSDRPPSRAVSAADARTSAWVGPTRTSRSTRASSAGAAGRTFSPSTGGRPPSSRNSVEA